MLENAAQSRKIPSNHRNSRFKSCKKENLSFEVSNLKKLEINSPRFWNLQHSIIRSSKFTKLENSKARSQRRLTIKRQSETRLTCNYFLHFETQRAPIERWTRWIRFFRGLANRTEIIANAGISKVQICCSNANYRQVIRESVGSRGRKKTIWLQSKDSASLWATCNLFPVARPHQDQLDPACSRTILEPLTIYQLHSIDVGNNY